MQLKYMDVDMSNLAASQDNSEYNRNRQAMIAENNMISYFDSVVISSFIGTSKPHSKMYNTALQELNVKPEEINKHNPGSYMVTGRNR